jgi:hypothetical protein
MALFNAHGPALQVALFAAGQLPDPAEVDRMAEFARARFAA